MPPARWAEITSLSWLVTTRRNREVYHRGILGPMAQPPQRPRIPPLPSRTQGIGDALAGSAPLVLLSRRMRESQDRLAAITPLLPPAMHGSVRAGPIDETGWSLLASSNAVAAKLRQMLPALEAHLRTCGWDGPPLRVKLLSPG